MNTYLDLTTLKDIKTGLNITSSDYDARLLDLVEAVSRSIDEYCSRVFYVSLATKYYSGVADDSISRLDPWGGPIIQTRGGGALSRESARLWLTDGDDLLSVTSLTMDTDGDRTYETTLDSATDYRLWPYNETPKIRVDLDIVNGQLASWGYGDARVKITGKWGYQENLITLVPTMGVLASSGVTATTSASTGLAIGQTWLIDAEQVYVTAGSGTSWTITRGVNGTTAASHLAASVMYLYRYPGQVMTATMIQTSRIWKRKDDGFATVVGSEEMGNMRIWKGLDPDVQQLLNGGLKVYQI